MPRTLSSEFLRLKAEPTSTPIEIWDVHLGSQDSVDSNTIFLAVTNRNIRFFSHVDGSPRVFIGTGLGRGPISRNMDSKIDNVEISLENVDRTFSALFLTIDLRGKRIVIRKVFNELLGSLVDAQGNNNFLTLFDGVIDSPRLTQTRFEAQLRNNFFQSLSFNVPRRTFQGLCNWKFGASGDCAGHRTQQELYDTKTNQTIDIAVTQLNLRDSARTEGGSGDYWAPGIIEMTGGTTGNIGVKRRIIQSSISGDLFLEANFPFTVVAGDEYTIQRDCGHTHDRDCQDRFQNQTEFGGFITIPDALVRKE